MDVVDLVERAARGDRDAFDLLVSDAVDRLYAMARLILRDADLAEDAVQEALIHCWRELPRLRDPERFEAWLRRMVVNACYDEGRKTRRALCEALAISCKNNVDVLIHRLWDSRWYVVRNLLYVLGRIGHHGVERALGEALYHDDVRVRREAVRALGGIDSPTSRAYLNSALRDPDRSVRLLVAQTVVKRVDERAAQILWGVIESPEFAGRDADERTAFFVALGRAGSDALVPRLEKVLTRGGLFRAGPDGGRVEAAMALAWIGTPAAQAVLNREVTSVREEVRRAVGQALEAVRKAGEKEKPAG